MAATNVTEPQLNKAHVMGAKNQTNLQTVLEGVATAVKTELGGTSGTHPTYSVQIKVTRIGL